jgi:hypothetical protein
VLISGNTLIERGLEKLTIDEMDKAAELFVDQEEIKAMFGGELPIVTLKDVADALLPRITLNPGGIFSATFFRENGSIQWAGRFLGKGKLSWLQIENMFRVHTLNDVINGLRKGTMSMKEALNLLKEESIVDFNLFRNSPLAANVKMYGTKIQSVAMKMTSKNNIIRLRNRMQFFEWKRKVDKDGKITYEVDREKRGLITNLVMFPGKALRFTWQRNLKGARAALVKLTMWRGSILHAARDLRINYKDAQQHFAEALGESLVKTAKGWVTLYEHLRYNLKPSQFKRLKTWDEVTRYIGHSGRSFGQGAGVRSRTHHRQGHSARDGGLPARCRSVDGLGQGETAGQGIQDQDRDR